MAPPPHMLDLMGGAIARAQGDEEMSRQHFEKARDPKSFIDLAWAYAGLGRAEEALQTAQEAVQLVPTWRDAAEGPHYAAMQAQIQAWLGNKEAAIEQLNALVKQPAGPSYGDLKFNPGWDQLRGDPGFDKLLSETQKPITLQ